MPRFAQANAKHRSAPMATRYITPDTTRMDMCCPSGGAILLAEDVAVWLKTHRLNPKLVGLLLLHSIRCTRHARVDLFPLVTRRQSPEPSARLQCPAVYRFRKGLSS